MKKVLFDLYYSEMSNASMIKLGMSTPEIKVDGKVIRYTEAIIHEKKPLTVYDDLRYVGQAYLPKTMTAKQFSDEAKRAGET
jgi:hypothetical protein